MSKSHIIHIHHLSAGVPKGQTILSDVTCTFDSKKIYAIMGPNGSGKSTLANVIMGNPSYEVHPDKKGVMWFDTVCFDSYPAEKRAALGVFLAFQSPIAVPGVTVIQLLRSAYQAVHADAPLSMSALLDEIRKYQELLHIDASLLDRSVHDGFSGGERKKIEVLQALILHPSFAIFDEIDTGLDVDALQIVADGVNLLHGLGTGIILITHYQRLLKYVRPNAVYIFRSGRLIATGTNTLAKKIEKEGYQAVS